MKWDLKGPILFMEENFMEIRARPKEVLFLCNKIRLERMSYGRE